MSDLKGAIPEPHALLGRVIDESNRPWSELHGIGHWQAVADIGLRLAIAEQADCAVVFLFGLLHDTRRESEGFDPHHGKRAGQYAWTLWEEGHMLLSSDQIRLLVLAIENHNEGRRSVDPTVGCCWDADRLCLPRVGKPVEASYLSTETGLAAAFEPDWPTILNNPGRSFMALYRAYASVGRRDAA